MKFLFTVFTLAFSLFSHSQDLFESKQFGLRVDFPDKYEQKETEDDESNAVSLSSAHQEMIFVMNAIQFKKEYTDDERSRQEAITMKNVCETFGAKFKLKKVTSWKVGEELGYICPIKGKLKGTNSTVTFYGNFYIVFIGDTQYQLTVLSQKKKTFNGDLERAFWRSFKLL